MRELPPAHLRKKGMKIFSLSWEDAQHKNDWRLRIQGAGNQLMQIYVENSH